MQKDEDPYKILGVPYDASEADIKKAYRKAALKYHPDRQQTEEDKERAHDTFAKVSEAYATLTDPVKRYDWKMANEAKIKGRSNGSASTSQRQTSNYHATTSRKPSGFSSPRPTKFSTSSHIPRSNNDRPFAGQQTHSTHARPNTPQPGRGRKVPLRRTPPQQTFSWQRHNKNGTTTDDTAYNFSSGTNAGKKKQQPYSFKPGMKEDLRGHTMHGTGTSTNGGIGLGNLFKKKEKSATDGGYSLSGKNGRGVSREVTRTPRSRSLDKKSMVRPNSTTSLKGRSPGTLRRAKLPAAPFGEDIDARSTSSGGASRGRKTKSERRLSGAHRRPSLSRASASPARHRKNNVEIDEVTRTPRTGRKKTVSKKPHDPLGVFLQIMREQFDYDKDIDKGGLFGTKNITAKGKTDDNGPDAVMSMSTKTQTDKRKDGKFEIKTITKIKRGDGSVEKNVQVSIVEKEEANKLPKNTDLNITRIVDKKKKKKREK